MLRLTKLLKMFVTIVSKAFIKCDIKFYKDMSNMTKDFNHSRKLCNVVNFKLKFNTVLLIFVFICSKRVQVQEKTR